MKEYTDGEGKQAYSFKKNHNNYVKKQIMRTFEATIAVLIGTSKDPTNGTTAWYGGEDQIEKRRKSHDVRYGNMFVIITPASDTGTKKSYHIFFELTTKYTKQYNHPTGQPKTIFINHTLNGHETSRTTLEEGKAYDLDFKG